MKNSFNPMIIPSQKKTEDKIIPYLSFPITKFCQFRCLYCGVGGETTASYIDKASYNFVLDRVRVGYDYGIRKFRLTGGEPFSHQSFEKITDTVSGFNGTSLLVNTNGFLLTEKQEWLKSVNCNVRFAVSFDSLDQNKYDWITGIKGNYNRVLRGIKLLAKLGKLTRLNLVVTKYNIDEVSAMIDFCRSLACNIKLLEVCSVPIPYNKWENFHIKLNNLETQLQDKATSVEAHEYSKSFGIPMPIYNLDGVKVTLKSSSYGSRYDLEGICKGCEYFPCHEGLYDMYLLPDNRLCGCRWSERSVTINEDFIKSLDYMTEVFQRANWLKLKNLKPMLPLPPFVHHHLTNNERKQ